MPGPTPTFCPVFPEPFLQQARVGVRCKTASYQSVQRYRLVLLFYEHPQMSHEEAAQSVGLSVSQVRRWRKRWAVGEFSIANRSGRGRKAAFSPAGPCLGQSAGL